MKTIMMRLDFHTRGQCLASSAMFLCRNASLSLCSLWPPIFKYLRC